MSKEKEIKSLRKTTLPLLIAFSFPGFNTAMVYDPSSAWLEHHQDELNDVVKI